MEPSVENLWSARKNSRNQAGKVLADRYEIKELLGEGAMAIVYKALDRNSGELVAVKKVLGDDPEILQRFAREVELHRSLEHENIVEAIDAVTDENGDTYFVMELLDGLSLHTYLHHEKRIERAEDIFSIIDQICDALQHAHDVGILHRDLKPGNIFLHQGENGFAVKVLDFGIAKPLGEVKGLTQAGTAVGSPMYMSPEQCQGKRVDTRSDVYSLGILCYELITGTIPYKGQNIMTILAAHCDPERKPPSIVEIRSDLKLIKYLNNILMKALETKQEYRFSTIAELRKAISLWFEASRLEPADQIEVLKKLAKMTAVPQQHPGKRTVQDVDAISSTDIDQLPEQKSPAVDTDEMLADELAAYKQIRMEQKNQLRTRLEVNTDSSTSARKPNMALIWGSVLMILLFIAMLIYWALKS